MDNIFMPQIFNLTLTISCIILMISLLYRGSSLISLFFRLWRRREAEELYSKVIFQKSSLVPPVSLFLILDNPKVSLVDQIKSFEEFQYRELELIVIRDRQLKDQDSLDLKDYQFRYRSPLYFSDLSSEDPHEILEVSAKRRILIIYSSGYSLTHALTLFLKCARYPLVGFLKDSITLDQNSISRLMFRWVREGDQNACVYGFIKIKENHPTYFFLNALLRGHLFVEGARKCSLSDWYLQDGIFCLIPKNIAIQTMSRHWKKWQWVIYEDTISNYEFVGEKSLYQREWLHQLTEIAKIPLRLFQNIISVFRFPGFLRGWKSILSHSLMLGTLILWPLLLASFILRYWFPHTGFESMNFMNKILYYLMGSELLLFALVLLITKVYVQFSIQKLVPLPNPTQVRDAQILGAEI